MEKKVALFLVAMAFIGLVSFFVALAGYKELLLDCCRMHLSCCDGFNASKGVVVTTEEGPCCHNNMKYCHERAVVRKKVKHLFGKTNP